MLYKLWNNQIMNILKFQFLMFQLQLSHLSIWLKVYHIFSVYITLEEEWKRIYVHNYLHFFRLLKVQFKPTVVHDFQNELELKSMLSY